jgi:hypothetical protein
MAELHRGVLAPSLKARERFRTYGLQVSYIGRGLALNIARSRGLSASFNSQQVVGDNLF